MKRRIFAAYLLILLMFGIMLISGCAKKQNPEAELPGNESPIQSESTMPAQDINMAKSVLEKHFKCLSLEDTEGLLETLTNRWSDAGTDWGFDNQESVELISITESFDEVIIKSYLESGMGSVNGTTAGNLKVFKVVFEKKYSEEYEGFEDQGICTWWYYLIRENINAPWLIDDFGL